jgi:hypothetical protein
VLLSLQLLAYLSKYPRIRDLFHTAYEKNVFSVVEKFCRRIHPNAIQYWAGVVMRNACRKDETRDGIRRCANMSCVKWESSPREFAKCRRCRKAKYCSKACQSKAWADGHRWWCIERQATNLPPTTQIPQTTTAVAAPPPSQAEAAVVVDLPSTHDMTVIEQDMNEHTTNASESSESRPMLMEMGVRMEL